MKTFARFDMDTFLSIISIITLFTMPVRAGTIAPETSRDHNHMKDKELEAVHIRKETQELENTHLKESLEQLKIMFIQLKREHEQLRSEFTQVIEKQNAELHRRRQVHCRSDFTWWHDTVGKSLEYLDNFDIHCRHGEFLQQWRMTWGEMGGKKAIRYSCCKFNFTHEPD